MDSHLAYLLGKIFLKPIWGNPQAPIVFSTKKIIKNAKRKNKRLVKKLVNRTRNRQMILRFSEEEYKDFQRKFKDSKQRNYTDFVISSVRKIPIFVVDVKPLLSLSEQISKIGVNINQIARVTNTTQNIYENDVNELKENVEKILSLVKENLKTWSRIGVGNFNGIHENHSD